VDFGAAIRSLGRRVYFTPAASIVHLRGRSVAAAPAATAIAYRRSRLAFYRKHDARWVPWLRVYLWLQGKLPPPPADT
jgi:GT2 family glycosyltransferase